MIRRADDSRALLSRIVLRSAMSLMQTVPKPIPRNGNSVWASWARPEMPCASFIITPQNGNYCPYRRQKDVIFNICHSKLRHISANSFIPKAMGPAVKTASPHDIVIRLISCFAAKWWRSTPSLYRSISKLAHTNGPTPLASLSRMGSLM